MVLCPEFRGKLLLSYLVNTQLFTAELADGERIPGAKQWELQIHKRVQVYHTLPLVLSHGCFSDNSNRLLAPFWSGWGRDELIQDFMWPNSENMQLFRFSMQCSASILFMSMYLQGSRTWKLTFLKPAALHMSSFLPNICCNSPLYQMKWLVRAHWPQIPSSTGHF